MKLKDLILEMKIKTIIGILAVLFLIGFFYGRCNHD